MVRTARAGDSGVSRASHTSLKAFMKNEKETRRKRKAIAPWPPRLGAPARPARGASSARARRAPQRYRPMMMRKSRIVKRTAMMM